MDLDLTKELEYKVLVERQCCAFFVVVKLEYENIPYFCSLCNTIGHNYEACERMKSDDGPHLESDKKNKEIKKVYKQVDNTTSHDVMQSEKGKTIVFDHVNEATHNHREPKGIKLKDNNVQIVVHEERVP